MNKSVLVKLISNTKFSELSEEKLSELWYIINKEELKKKCTNCGSTKLLSYSSLQYRQCVSCGSRLDWKLQENEQPLVKHQR